jgi:hypothetical protein
MENRSRNLQAAFLPQAKACDYLLGIERGEINEKDRGDYQTI